MSGKGAVVDLESESEETGRLIGKCVENISGEHSTAVLSAGDTEAVAA